jgi:hypothetical protein
MAREGTILNLSPKKFLTPHILIFPPLHVSSLENIADVKYCVHNNFAYRSYS